MKCGKVKILEKEDLKKTIEHYKRLEEMNNRLDVELQHIKLNYWYRKWQKLLDEMKAELGEETPVTGAPAVVDEPTSEEKVSTEE